MEFFLYGGALPKSEILRKGSFFWVQKSTGNKNLKKNAESRFQSLVVCPGVRDLIPYIIPYGP
jgi:hypothetical protein